MGGAGGSRSTESGPADIMRLLLHAQKATRDAGYEVATSGYLNSLLARFNSRDVRTIDRYLAEIEQALERKLDAPINLGFGGSVSKRTYVDGLSDVDALLFLDNCELANRPPTVAKRFLAETLREQFPRIEVREGRLAVTVDFPDAEIQLLPATSCRGGVKISDPSGEGWATIQPRVFADALTTANDECGRKLVPVVKLAKAIISELPAQQQINGYHAESLGVAVFSGYGGSFTSRDMLEHYFREGAKRVLEPIRDRTGQSIHVDDSLGAANSLERRIIGDAMAQVARRMANAEAGRRIEDWHDLFGVG
jgi:hypothetical protein